MGDRNYSPDHYKHFFFSVLRVTVKKLLLLFKLSLHKKNKKINRQEAFYPIITMKRTINLYITTMKVLNRFMYETFMKSNIKRNENKFTFRRLKH